MCDSVATGQEVGWEKKKLFKVREFNFEPGKSLGILKNDVCANEVLQYTS